MSFAEARIDRRTDRRAVHVICVRVAAMVKVTCARSRPAFPFIAINTNERALRVLNDERQSSLFSFLSPIFLFHRDLIDGYEHACSGKTRGLFGYA